ncbi:hypothetical protein [Jeotgalicoccus psychrophilus]|uniref:hypothetical protein n=1 Tax=Jeotgalicoccus psychrophilus TaxID=157228 RepID=UPI000403F419|nr:hypothetical protein [Jeotgalicoccus psychrophilus]
MIMIKKKSWIMSLMLATALFLTACGGTTESKITGITTESKITGIWKLDEDEEPTFLEIGEEQIISRKPSNDEPMIVSYIFTETQNDNFFLEAINPEDGSKVFLLEGYMDGKDRIAVVDAPGDPADLIRVDDMEKEIEEHEKKAKAAEEEQTRIDTAQRKEEKRQEEQEKADEKARTDEEEREENERKVAAEEREKEELAETEKEDEEENEKSEVVTAAATSKPSNGSVKDEYYQKARNLHDEMNSDASEIYSEGGTPSEGFAGQYYTDWDNMLNEVWSLLEVNMPSDEYEVLLAEQLEWIEMKEHTFATEYSDLTAAEREKRYAYLSNATQERARYLIDNYLE